MPLSDVESAHLKQDPLDQPRWTWASEEFLGTPPRADALTNPMNPRVRANARGVHRATATMAVDTFQHVPKLTLAHMKEPYSFDVQEPHVRLLEAGLLLDFMHAARPAKQVGRALQPRGGPGNERQVRDRPRTPVPL